MEKCGGGLQIERVHLVTSRNMPSLQTFCQKSTRSQPHPFEPSTVQAQTRLHFRTLHRAARAMTRAQQFPAMCGICDRSILGLHRRNLSPNTYPSTEQATMRAACRYLAAGSRRYFRHRRPVAMPTAACSHLVARRPPNANAMHRVSAVPPPQCKSTLGACA